MICQICVNLFRFVSNPLVPLYSYLNLFYRGALCHALLITLCEVIVTSYVGCNPRPLFYKCMSALRLFDLNL